MQHGCQAQLSVCLPAEPESIAPLRRAAVAFAVECGASARRCEDIALAVSEALSNTVLHAYVGQPIPGSMSLEGAAVDDSLELVVCDEGRGMLPRHASTGLSLGLPLIVGLAEKVEVEDIVPGMRLRMTFRIG